MGSKNSIVPINWSFGNSSVIRMYTSLSPYLVHTLIPFLTGLVGVISFAAGYFFSKPVLVHLLQIGFLCAILITSNESI